MTLKELNDTVEALKLAPLEDTLVAEIIEHERGKCELGHSDRRDGPCTVVAVAIHSSVCASEDRLACRAGVEYYRLALSTPGARCADCEQYVTECWSVVMLP